jgi:hypothetical protein
MLLFLSILASVLVAQGFEYVYDVDPNDVASVHHQDFLASLLNRDKRRSFTEQEEFFKLHGVSSDAGGGVHEFLLKPAMLNTPQVILLVNRF